VPEETFLQIKISFGTHRIRFVLKNRQKYVPAVV